MSIGLASALVVDLHANVSLVRLIVTCYAACVVIGASVFTALAARCSRKRLLLGVMLAFTAGNALVSLPTQLLPLL